MKIITHSEKANKFIGYVGKYYDENRNSLLIKLSETDNIKKILPLDKNGNISFLKMLHHSVKLWKDFFTKDPFLIFLLMIATALSLITLNNLRYEENPRIAESTINIMMMVISSITILGPLIFLSIKETALFFLWRRKEKKGINIRPLLIDHITGLDTYMYAYKELEADVKIVRQFKKEFSNFKLSKRKYTYYELIKIIS